MNYAIAIKLTHNKETRMMVLSQATAKTAPSLVAEEAIRLIQKNYACPKAKIALSISTKKPNKSKTIQHSVLKTIPKTASNPAKTQEFVALTDADKLMTASNLVQWGLIGAAYYGVAPKIIMPLNFLSSLGSEIANFCMLPKDVSWLRKALSIPVLSKMIIHYNPWVAAAFKITSLYNLVESSAIKLKNTWDTFQSHPKEAIQSGATHLFNLVSGIAFTTGLVQIPKSNPPSLNQKKCNPAAVANHPCNDCGMFATNLYVVGLLDQFENGKYSGVKIDFEKNGVYYDPSYGPNWFEYYFCPVNIANDQCPNAPIKTFTAHELGDLSSYAERVYGYEESGLPPERAKMLIEKYLILKPEIQSEIDQFTQTHFSESDSIVGVHYRGTDKSSEARRVSYEEMTSNVKRAVQELSLEGQKNVKIFAASDEEPFIHHLSKEFPGQVIASPSKRAVDGRPLHFNAQDPYQVGKEAVIDCWLLAKLSNILVRTSSNLSKFASLFVEKGTKIIEVSKRYYQDPAL